MAKWRLNADHYLNVVRDQYDELVNYEYSETDQQTNRARRRTWPVPLFCEKGMIVSNDEADQGMIIFKGDPTPDMAPLDPTAEALSQKLSSRWKHAIESLNVHMGEDYSQSIIQGLGRLIDKATMTQGTPAEVPVIPNTSGNGVDPAAFKALQDQMAQLTEMNAKLMADQLDLKRPEAGEPIEPLKDSEPVLVVPPKKVAAHAQASRRA